MKANAITDIAKHRKKKKVKDGFELGRTLPCVLTLTDRSTVNIKQATTR